MGIIQIDLQSTGPEQSDVEPDQVLLAGVMGVDVVPLGDRQGNVEFGRSILSDANLRSARFKLYDRLIYVRQGRQRRGARRMLVVFPIGAGVLILLLTPILKRMMHGIK